ncbi:MAG: hypothetical protein A2Y25_09910 [Candidatus Melainabacteria bacterium GWF2_37_15]|nr:MAG: hypothetical protein A2Y25_09910 [Candidatus Melainabacteria bacterium GWF2_37_15]
MEYQVRFLNEAEKDLENLCKAGINLKPLERYFSRLQNNPYLISKSKKGDLGDCRAVEWGAGYRLIFKILENDKIVLILAIDKHDDAYKKAKKRNK